MKFLSYIESTGTQYIDTGVSVNANTYTGLKVVVDCDALSAINPNWAVNGISGGGVVFYLGITNGNIVAYGNGTLNLTTGKTYTSGKMVFDLDVPNKRYTVGNLLSMTNLTFSTPTGNQNFYLFAYNTGSGAVGHRSRIYSCQIYSNGTLVRDFVPAQNDDGTVGLYDKANGAFYANAGTGEFVAGEALVEMYSVNFTGLANDRTYYARVYPMNPEGNAQSEIGTQVGSASPTAS